MLKVKNNWEALSYFWNDTEITSIKRIKMGDDNKSWWYDARLQEVIRSYNDMGHENSVHTKELQVFVWPLNEWVPLTSKAQIIEIEGQ